MSAPTCAGPICRCPAPSSRCCDGLSRCPATPPVRGRKSRAKRKPKPWRRCARWTVSARSGRRPRPRSHWPPISAIGRRRIIPPGFYGPADGPLAVNTLAAADRIAPLDTAGLRARRASYTNSEPRDLRGILLSSSLALFLIDAVIVALLGAGIAALLRRRAAPAALAFALLLPTVLTVPSPTRADSADDFAIKATTQTRLAYVLTGNPDVDFHRQGGNGRTDLVSRATHCASRPAIPSASIRRMTNWRSSR